MTATTKRMKVDQAGIKMHHIVGTGWTCLRGRHDYQSWGEAPAGERLTAEEMAAWGELPANGGGR